MYEVHGCRYEVRGVSIGGVYTSMHVPELDVLFDVGTALRSTASVDTLFISHGHVDHIGALPSLLGIRGLVGMSKPLRVFMPAEIESTVRETLETISKMHRWTLDIDAVPMSPGDDVPLRHDLHVRAFRTFHPVPSLGYMIFRRVDKLKPEFRHLPGAEIGELRRRGEPIFDRIEKPELAYATDTLPKVFDREPWLFDVPQLIVECTFLDARKHVAAARAGCHIHLDDILPFAHEFRNDCVLFMHFSQIYRPHECESIVERRCREPFGGRVIPFIPDADDWPG